MSGSDDVGGTVLREIASPAPLLLSIPRFGDERGFFSETWNRRRFMELGLDVDFVQDNHSHSQAVGVVRGLHFQAPPYAQGKLIRVVRGSVVDVAVDIRRGSPSYGKWCSVRLSAANGAQFYVPVGFLHGFATRESDTEVLYKCTDYYAPESEGAVRFDDPDLGIEWGVDPSRAVVSAKDRKAMDFAGFETPFTYGDE